MLIEGVVQWRSPGNFLLTYQESSVKEKRENGEEKKENCEGKVGN